MKAKIILEAIAALRAADQTIDLLANQILQYQTGHLKVAQQCSHAANMLEVCSGLADVEIKVDLREQFDKESA